MAKWRRVSLISAGAIVALLAIVLILVLWPRGTPVKFANVTGKPLTNVEVEFVGALVRFQTIPPRSTVVRSIPFGRAARADGVAKPCPIVRLSFGDGEPLVFGPGEPAFKIPVEELNFQLDESTGVARIRVEAIERSLIGYRYTSFHMKPVSATKDDPR